MMTLDECSNYLNQLLPTGTLLDYCPNGLQIEGKQVIKSLATAVSADLQSIERAIELGVDALIVHHGLFWNKDSYVIQGVKKRKLELLFLSGISLFAYHLPLDTHLTVGNNWKAAKDLGWQQLEPFTLLDKNPIGVKGILSPISREKFKLQLEDYYQHPAFCALGGPEMISSAALISGGAHKYITQAIQENVDAFITGSFDEPIWHQAFEERINFFALGHSSTERVGPKALAEHLSEVFRLPCLFIDTENPF